MKRYYCLCPCVLVMLLGIGGSLEAAAVWNGPLITYSQPAADPTQPTNQDRITADVWLTRGASKGLFNAFSETNATAPSPADTEWACGALTNFATLNYTNWLAMLDGQSPTTLIGRQTVVHLVSDDIYLSLEFTAWVPGGSGGFAYQRSTAALPIVLTGAAINSRQFSFSYAATAGFDYVIQSSSNLVDWTSLATNIASGNLESFSDFINPNGVNFYRVALLMNP